LLPGKDTINEIFGIVQTLNDAERKLIKEESKKSYFRGERMIFWLPAVSFMAASILAIAVTGWTSNPSFKYLLPS
jgi:hypothetical protein